MNLKSLTKSVMTLPWVRFPVRVMQRFGEDNGGLFSAGLAFFVLLSFAPLLLTAVAVMAFFIHDPAQAALRVQDLAKGLFPSGHAQDEMSHFLNARLNLNDQASSLVKGRSIAGLLGFATLIWTSMQIFVNASSAMNAAFEVKEKRSWLTLRAIALGLLFASGILISLTLFLSTAPSAISGYGRQYIPDLPVPFWLLTTLFEFLAILLNSFLYVIIYRFLPAVEVEWNAAFTGGLVASIFWEIAKKGLATWFLKANHSIYGSLGNLILFVLWIYYSMMIMLIGAEVAAETQKATRIGPGGKSDHGSSSPDFEEQQHTPHRAEGPSGPKAAKGRD